MDQEKFIQTEMDHVLRLDISFSKKQSVFLAGENIEGCIHMEVRQELDVEECNVQLVGELNTRKATLVNLICPKLSRNVQNVLESRQILFRRRRILTGRLDLPFAFPLPPDLPQSLECWPLAHLRYYLKATLAFPGRDQELEARRMCSVLEHKAPHSSNAASQIIRESLLRPIRSPFCINEGFVEVQMGLKKNYFVPGEDVVVSLLVDNQSPRVIKRVSVSIRQVVHTSLAAQDNPQPSGSKRLMRSLLRRTGQQSWAIASQEAGAVLPNTVAQQRRCKLHLAAVPCSAAAGAGTAKRPIDVCYVVQLSVKLGLGRGRLVLECPITVGSTPLSAALSRPDVTDGPLSALSRPRPPLPSAFVESALGPVNYCSLRTAGGRTPYHLMCSYTPCYFYFPTISCVPKPGTPSTLRSILKPRSVCSTLSAPSSIGFSDTASTLTSASTAAATAPTGSDPSLHFESPV